MSSKKKSKKESLFSQFCTWMSGAHRNPSLADCVFAIAKVEWDLLRLKLVIKEGDYLVAKRLRELENFGKPWYQKRWF